MASAGQVLSFATVGCHGRGWCTPAFALAGFGAVRRFSAGVLMFFLAATPAWSQPAYVQDFASRIASALAPGASVRLVCTGDDGRTQRDVAKALADRHVRVSDVAEGTTIVRCSCLENLKERACVADIGDGSDRRVVAATNPRDRSEPAVREQIVALELQPLFAARDPILDVAAVDSGLLVLTPMAVTVVAAPAKDGSPAAAPLSQPIATGRVWPRDLRGRVQTSGSGFQLFLPGVTCRGSLTPFALACADEVDPWPIGIENSGIIPSRNTFATPEGFSFYDAAPLANQRWLVVDQQGILTFLDARRRVVAKGGAADHAAALKAACASDSHVATTARSPGAEGADVVLLSRVSGETLVPLGSSLVLPGVLTALWPAPDDRAATAIVRNVRAGRYEAFHLSLSCTR